MYRLYGNFYIPKYKYELVNILSIKYPKDRYMFETMDYNQLLAIYCNYRRRNDKAKEVETNKVITMGTIQEGQ